MRAKIRHGSAVYEVVKWGDPLPEGFPKNVLVFDDERTLGQQPGQPVGGGVLFRNWDGSLAALHQGDFIVNLEEGLVRCYTPSEFQAMFDLVAEVKEGTEKMNVEAQTLEQFANQPAFPVTPRSLACSDGGEGNRQLIDNEIVGGIALVDYIAIEFAKAYLTNPAYVGLIYQQKAMTVERLQGMAIENAKTFVKQLFQAKTPCPAPSALHSV